MSEHAVEPNTGNTRVVNAMFALAAAAGSIAIVISLVVAAI